MGRKVGLAAAIIFLIICVIAFVKSLGTTVDKKFADVEMVYENRVEEKGVNDRYYYKRLDEKTKIAYTLVVPEISKHTEKIEIPKLDDDELDALMYAISYDNPELICYGSNCQLISEMGKFYFVPSYTHSAEQHEACMATLENALYRVATKLPAGDEYKRELYIHDFICKNCRYINDGGELKTSAYDALVLGEAVCEGYSRAAQLLFNRAGIHNYLVTGNARNPDGQTVGHMWNVVNINSQNYYLDITWDDADNEDPNRDGCYFYFNVDQQFINRDHYDISPTADNGCGSMFDNYYSRENSLFYSFDSVALGQLEDNAVRNILAGEYSSEMMFTNHEAYEKLKKELLDTGDVVSVIEDINSRQSVRQFRKVEYSMYDNMDYIKFVFS